MCVHVCVLARANVQASLLVCVSAKAHLLFCWVGVSALSEQATCVCLWTGSGFPISGSPAPSDTQTLLAFKKFQISTLMRHLRMCRHLLLITCTCTSYQHMHREHTHTLLKAGAISPPLKFTACTLRPRRSSPGLASLSFTASLGVFQDLRISLRQRGN